MRLLVKLVPKKTHAYVNDYHYHLQAAIYSLIREGGLPDVHNKKGYKFFCFSNIFPYGQFKEGAEKNLLVSSPDLKIIKSIERACLSKIESGGALFVGGLQFAISSISKPFRIDLGAETMVHSATPIVMRIPRAKYGEYGITPQADYNYVFWRETIQLEAFVKQLRDNIEKKWWGFTGDAVKAQIDREAAQVGSESVPEAVYYKFLRTVSKPITLKNERQMVVGSLWEMSFVTATERERKVLEFAVDCGFGERNSLGFGFMNARSTSSVYKEVEEV